MSILEKIYGSALKFLVPLTSEETYRVVGEEATKLVGGQYSSILLESGGGLERVYATSPLSYKIGVRSEGLRYQAFKEGKAEILHSKTVEKLKKVHPELSELHGKSVIFIPLTNQGQSIGLLTVVSSKDKSFGKNSLEILKLFGSLASLAIRKAQLYNETKQALDNRDLFISLAAHELRTPLTTLDGYIQLLLSKMRNNKPIQDRWFMELALESQRLKTLMQEFLEINSIRNGKLQYNWAEVKLKEILKHAISSFRFNNPTRKIILSDELSSNGGKIIADQDKLLEVFTNILENAEKYSPDEKDINVLLKREDSYLLVEITDKGQGIKKKDMPLVFKGFYKGENSLHEGMGLGLYLAKNIIDSHHGEISIKSKLNEGTKVRIKLPQIQ